MIALLDSRTEARVGHLAFRPVHLRLALPPGAVKAGFLPGWWQASKNVYKVPSGSLATWSKKPCGNAKGHEDFWRRIRGPSAVDGREAALP